MTTNITVIYDNPADISAFEASYPHQVTLAQAVPTVLKVDSAHVLPKEDGSATPAHRLLDLTFQDYATASAAVTTDEAGEFFAAVFLHGTGGVRIVFTEFD